MAQPLIQPEQIDKIPILDQDKKARYKEGLSQLWRQFHQNPEGSQLRQEAENKIRSVSRKLMEEMAARGKQGQAQGQGQGQGQAQGQGQGQPRPGSNQGPANPQQGAGQPRPPTQQGNLGGAGPQQQQQQQQQQVGTPQQQAQPQPQPQQGGPSQPAANPGPLPHWIQRELQLVNIVVPSNIPPSSHAAYKQKWYSTAATELQKKDRANDLGKKLQPTVKHHQQMGTQMPQDVANQWEMAKRMVHEVDARWGKMKAENEQRRQAAQQAAQQGGNAADMQRAGSMSGQQPGPVKQEGRMSNSPPQPQSNFQQPQPSVNAPTPQPPPPSQTPVQPTPQPQQQQPFQPQAPPQQQQAPQQQQYNPQQQQRPQLTQHISGPQVHQAGGPQQTPAGGPMQQRANSAGPQQPQQRPQALSQQAAVAQATAAYQHQQQLHQQQQMQGQQPGQQGPPPGQPPQGQQMQAQQPPQMHPNAPQFAHTGPAGPPSAGAQPTPNSQVGGGFGGMPQPGQQSGGGGNNGNGGPPSMQATTTPNNKFPIAKQLHLDPRSQQPVQGPPSRPTLGQSGMVSQPGLQRPPAYTLEGEGDRVLSKRKLDELVRQVTGGAGLNPTSTTSSSTTTSTSTTHPADPPNTNAPAAPAPSTDPSSFLDPLVEESLLTLADDFVDAVLTSACQLAKLRPGAAGSPSLELRDVQMALERNWGIRVPGYTLEEVRGVKRFAPSVEWQRKMGAVGGAKTLGGVGRGEG